MPTKPVTRSSWATDANFSSGPESGNPTKVTPSGAQLAQGLVPGDPLAGQWVNYILNEILDTWLDWVEDGSNTADADAHIVETASDGIVRAVDHEMPFSSGVVTLGNTALGNFGDASDGNITRTSGTTTLTRDMYYDVLTVESGGVINADGYRIFANEVNVEAGGLIHNDGSSGQDGAAGGAAGAAAGAGSLGNGFAGGAGGSSGGAAGSGGTSLGGGGNSGGPGGAGSGGAGGSNSAPSANYGGLPGPTARLGFLIGDAGTLSLDGGAGGGGGAGDTTVTGGGGGGGGGTLVICARVLTNAGTIRANGGVGGDGETGDTGGGGGGGGGLVLITSNDYTNTGTVEAAGGAGGAAGGGGGGAGGAGSAGVVQIYTF